MRKIKRNIARALAVVAGLAGAATTQAQAMTNSLTTIQAATSNINAAADTGLTIGLGLLGIGFALGALGWGLRASFKKRPT